MYLDRLAWGRSARFRRLLEQLLDGVIAACDSEIGLTLEWFANVMHRAGVAVKFDDGQDEFFRLIQGGKDLVLRDGDNLAPAARPLTSMNRSRPVPGMEDSRS